MRIVRKIEDVSLRLYLTALSKGWRVEHTYDRDGRTWEVMTRR